MVAINVAAVSFTHEFKPYAIDLLFHTAWLYALIAIPAQARALLASTVILLVGVFLSYSMVPIVAFQLIYMAYLLVKQRLTPREVAVPAVLLIAYILYFAALYPTLHGTGSRLWALKYGVFYSPAVNGTGVVSYLSWFLGKVSAYVTLPLNWYVEIPLSSRVKGFREGHGFVEAPALGLICLALMALKLWHSKLDDRRVIPVVLLMGYTLAGVLKMFPLGYFRSNLFLLCYATLTLLLLIEPLEKLPKRWFLLLIAGLTLPTLLFTARAPKGEKYFHSLPVTSILTSLCAKPAAKPITVIADGKLRSSIAFYVSRKVVPTCRKKLLITQFKTRDDLRMMVSAAKDAHIFFAGSTGFPASEIIEMLSHYPDMQCLESGGGSFHYFKGDGASAPAKKEAHSQ